jgi:hypothetical protein
MDSFDVVGVRVTTAPAGELGSASACGPAANLWRVPTGMKGTSSVESACLPPFDRKEQELGAVGIAMSVGSGPEGRAPWLVKILGGRRGSSSVASRRGAASEEDWCVASVMMGMAKPRQWRVRRAAHRCVGPSSGGRSRKHTSTTWVWVLGVLRASWLAGCWLSEREEK